MVCSASIIAETCGRKCSSLFDSATIEMIAMRKQPAEFPWQALVYEDSHLESCQHEFFCFLERFDRHRSSHGREVV